MTTTKKRREVIRREARKYMAAGLAEDVKKANALIAAERQKREHARVKQIRECARPVHNILAFDFDVAELVAVLRDVEANGI